VSVRPLVRGDWAAVKHDGVWRDVVFLERRSKEVS
jgi:hypothetical protein